MVDRPALSSRLSALEGYLTELRSFREVSGDDFRREPALLEDLAAFASQVAHLLER